MPRPSPSPEFQRYLDSLPEPHILIGDDYRIVAANRAYVAAYRPSPGVVGRTCHEVSHGLSQPCDRAGESCPMARARQTQRREAVLHRHHTADGDEFVHIELVRLEGFDPDRGLYLEKIDVLPVREPHAEPPAMVGRSPAFMALTRDIARVAPTSASVLLMGETGTGKEMAAAAIHMASARAAAPLVVVDCASIPDTLLESELFGHERGAFTGATKAKPGLVESANGGSLFLDELGDIPLHVQVKLLRFLESGMFRRVGSTEARRSDVRVISATHRDLVAMIPAGQFRADLYYRLGTVPLRLPPLRERTQDIPALCAHWLTRLAPNRGVRLDVRALRVLETHLFPGNVRELRNVLERALIHGTANVLGEENIRAAIAADPLSQLRAPISSEVSNRDPALEGPHLDQLVRRFSSLPFESPAAPHIHEHSAQLPHGRASTRKALAKALGISERTLYRRLRQPVVPKE